MARRKFLSLSEIEELVNDPNFQIDLLESDDEETFIDIVELPPESVDIVSDEEEIDEDDLGEQHPIEIAGSVEVHNSVSGTATATETANSAPQPAPKRKKTYSESSWRKARPDLCVERGNDKAINERIIKIKATLKSKSPVEVF